MNQFRNLLDNLLNKHIVTDRMYIIRKFCTMDTCQNLKNFVCNGKKIAGAGVNYNSLIRILNTEKPKQPVIFLKPSTSYIIEGDKIKIPKDLKVNEEIELGVVIGKKGRYIPESEALDYVGGYCAALDMTATSELTVARSKGLPWSIGKGFDTACPVSHFLTKEQIPDPSNVEIFCKVNGKEVQRGNTCDLIFSVPQLISYISQYMTLEPSDLILTGSPPGMGPVSPGDVIECGITDVVTMKFPVTSDKSC